jgi:hypothetical protein
MELVYFCILKVFLKYFILFFKIILFYFEIVLICLYQKYILKNKKIILIFF